MMDIDDGRKEKKKYMVWISEQPATWELEYADSDPEAADAFVNRKRLVGGEILCVTDVDHLDVLRKYVVAKKRKPCGSKVDPVANAPRTISGW